MFKQRGFTLIEVMIVVVIIGVLVAIVYPSYTQYKVRTNRADMQVEMMNIAQNLNRENWQIIVISTRTLLKILLDRFMVPRLVRNKEQHFIHWHLVHSQAQHGL